MTAALGAVTTAVVLALGALDGGTTQPATEAPPVPLAPSKTAAPSLATANTRAATRDRKSVV